MIFETFFAIFCKFLQKMVKKVQKSLRVRGSKPPKPTFRGLSAKMRFLGVLTPPYLSDFWRHFWFFWSFLTKKIQKSPKNHSGKGGCFWGFPGNPQKHPFSGFALRREPCFFREKQVKTQKLTSKCVFWGFFQKLKKPPKIDQNR